MDSSHAFRLNTSDRDGILLAWVVSTDLVSVVTVLVVQCTYEAVQCTNDVSATAVLSILTCTEFASYVPVLWVSDIMVGMHMQTFCSTVLSMCLLPMFEDEPPRNRIFPFCGSDMMQTDLLMVCLIFEKSGVKPYRSFPILSV